mgnify:FL=1
MDIEQSTIEILYGKRVREQTDMHDYVMFTFTDSSAICISKADNSIIELREHLGTYTRIG